MGRAVVQEANDAVPELTSSVSLPICPTLAVCIDVASNQKRRLQTIKKVLVHWEIGVDSVMETLATVRDMLPRRTL